MSILPYTMGYLTPTMMEKAETELGETDEVREKAMTELQNLVRGDSRLIYSDKKDDLIQYLRARKFNVERALELLRTEYKQIAKFPEIFTDPRFSDVTDVINRDIVNLLPHRNKDGGITLLLKYENWPLDEIALAKLIHTAIIIVVFSAFDPATQVCGMRVILDMKTSSLFHLQYLPIKQAIFLCVGAFTCLPVRMKGIHVVHGHRCAKYFWDIAKLLVSEKIRKRVHFHNSSEELYEYYDQSTLPVDYGGNTDYTDFTTRFLNQENEALYQRMLSYRYN